MSVFGNIANSQAVSLLNSITAKTPEQRALEKYEKTMDDLRSEQLVWEDQLEEDELALQELYDRKFNETSSFLDVVNIEESITESLTNLKDMLEAQFEDMAGQYTTLSNWLSADPSALEDQMIDMMMEPILEAIKPLQDLLPDLGLPELPIIGDLNKILKSFIAIGRIMYNMPEAAQQQDQETEAKAKKAGPNIWSKLKNTAMDILELIQYAFSQIQNVLIIVGFMAVMKLIEIIKPVLDAFQLVVSSVVQMLTIVDTVGKIMYGNIKALLIKLKKYFMKKIMKFLYLLEFLYRDGDGTLPIDDLIRATQRDIFSCVVEISSIDLNKSYEQSQFELENMTYTMGHLQDALKEKTTLTRNPFHMFNGKVSAASVNPEEIEDLERRISELEATMAKQQEIINKDKAVWETVSSEKNKIQYVEDCMRNQGTLSAMERSYLQALNAEREAKKQATAEEIQHSIANGTNTAGSKVKGSIAGAIV